MDAGKILVLDKGGIADLRFGMKDCWERDLHLWNVEYWTQQ